jgi:hypothetical protein
MESIMAKVTCVELGVYRVSGEFDTVYVLSSLDEVKGALYQVINTNEFDYGTYGDLDLAIEWAEHYADKADEYIDPEVGDGMTDAEADADALAGIGWGTDEDYDDCFDYDAYGDAF